MSQRSSGGPGAPSRPPAVVLGATTGGLSVVRTLGRLGVRVFVLDTPGTPGLSSRFGRPLPMPDVVAEPGAWLDALEILAQTGDAPLVLLPTRDEHVLFVSRHRAQLSRRFRFRLPPPDTVELLCDKQRQYEWLIAHGHPVPATVFVAGGEDPVTRVRAAVGFPCIVKPRRSHSWARRGTGTKLLVVNDEAELRRAVTTMVELDERFVVQALVPGDDRALHGYLGYWRDGRPVAGFTKQKLRQYPPGFGNGSLQISTRNDEVLGLSESILGGLAYDGWAAIECKRDARDGRYQVMEINPRAVSGNQLAIDSGVDLARVAYRELAGEPLPEATPYRTGVSYLHLGWDAQAMLVLRRRGEMTAVEWLRSLWPVRSFALFSLSDLRPFLSYLASAWRRRARVVWAAGLAATL